MTRMTSPLFSRFVAGLLATGLAAASITACSSKEKREEAKVTAKNGAKAAKRTGGSSGSGGSGYRLRPYEEKTLANGLRILYVKDDSLPYVSYSVMIRSGSASDPLANPGLSFFVSEMLEKGTAKRTALQIADDLGFIGADFSTAVTNDYSLVSASSLSTHADELLKNFAEIVTDPAFSADEVDRMRKQILAAIQKRVDDPEEMADTAWEDYLFESHPYAKPLIGTSRSISSVRRKNVIQQYLRHYRPNNAILAVTGQITPELMTKIETAFASWEQREVPAVTYPEFPKIGQTQIRVIDNPSLVQTQVRLGHKGIKRQNNEYIPLRVANTILGGAFASRLMDKVRNELGLTYGISSGFEARSDFGPFEISTFTKNESTGQAIAETMKVLESFYKSGVTDEEVARAKGYMKGIFPTSIETAEKTAFNLMVLRLYGIPDSYLTNYLRELNRVDVGEVNKVIKEYFSPEKMKILVYTNAKAVVPQLQPIGIVETRKLTDYQ